MYTRAFSFKTASWTFLIALSTPSHPTPTFTKLQRCRYLISTFYTSRFLDHDSQTNWFQVEGSGL